MDENDQEPVPECRLKIVLMKLIMCFFSLLDLREEVVYENTTEEDPPTGSTVHLYDYA